MNLIDLHCTPRAGAADRIHADEIAGLLAQLPGWALQDDGISIGKTFTFKDYATTMAYALRVAKMADAEDHHPDLSISYGRCSVRYNTHDVGGLSLNDFICAAKADQYAQS